MTSPAGTVLDEVLGIDVGTTYTAAAVAAAGDVDMLSLGSDRAAVPTVVVLRDDGEVLVGEAAERRAATQPERTAREFKRRVGDPVPLVLGGTPYGAESLVAHVVRWVVAEATARRGGDFRAVALSHPASWSTYKTDLLRHAAQQAGLADVVLITEPQAAAIHYAQQDRLADGTTVGVYDLGGGTFDAAVVRKVGERWELLGRPEGLERFGGIDLDQAVLAHVDRSLDGLLSELDRDDPATRNALVRLREDCRRAKEALSADTDTVIPVALPSISTEVRLTRAELESMARPRIVETVGALERAVRSAGLSASELDRVLLVGGSSRMPLIAEVVGQQLGVEVVADANPKLAIAYGVALAGRAAVEPGVATASIEVSSPPAGASPTTPPPAPPTDAVPPVAPTTPVPAPPSPPAAVGVGGDPGRSRVPLVAAAVIAAIVATGGAAWFLTRDRTTGAAGTTTTTTAPATPSTEPVPTTTAAADATTTTTSTPTTTASSPAAPAPSTERVSDVSGQLSVEVPAAWTERLTNAVEIGGVLAAQVSASPNQNDYARFVAPGVTVLAADEDEADPPEQILALLAPVFDDVCTSEPSESFSTTSMRGITRRWTACNGGATAYVHVGTADGVVFLVTGVTLTAEDDAAYRRALESVASA